MIGRELLLRQTIIIRDSTPSPRPIFCVYVYAKAFAAAQAFFNRRDAYTYTHTLSEFRLVLTCEFMHLSLLSGLIASSKVIVDLSLRGILLIFAKLAESVFFFRGIGEVESEFESCS